VPNRDLDARVHPATGRLLLLAAMAVVAPLACGTTRAPSDGVPGVAPGHTELGVATFYSDSLAGHATASGEPYRPGALTAAHRTLPLGTLVRVTRLDRDARPIAGPVVVRINDRGPYGRGRVIDL
jgi:rare lipoprotein A